MKLFEGKSPSEKNKIIAALVLGAMAVLAIGYNIIGLYPGRKTTTVNVTASPSPSASPKMSSDVATALSNEDLILGYSTTPVVYIPSAFYAPDAGRNIFAFYEPPPPTPYVSPVPIVRTPTPFPPAVPTPTPEFLVGFVNPQTVYAGAKSFRLEINGDRFTPNAVILFNGSQLPTTYISPQQLVAEIPANLISGEGPKQIMVVTPDGKFSNQFILNVQAPPRPQLLYIGAKLAQRGNNNTAYFREQSKNTEFAARLNDTVSGRFRVVSISREAVILEDASLGFRHRLPIATSAPGQSASLDPSGGGGFNNPNYSPSQQIYSPPQGELRPNYNVPQPARPAKADDVDDVEDDEE